MTTDHVTARTSLRAVTDIPDLHHYHGQLGAYLSSGTYAHEAVEAVHSTKQIAFDPETPSLEDSHSIKCITAAWYRDDGLIQSVILDPLRRPRDMEATKRILKFGSVIVLHKSSFDVPGMVSSGMLELDDIPKIRDTMIYARMAWSDEFVKRDLGALSKKLLGWNHAGNIEDAFTAAGYRSRTEGFLLMDVDSPVYRHGAMSDTVATLRLGPKLFQAAVDRTLDHPFPNHGITDPNAAAALVEKQQYVNHVFLRRSAIGHRVDLEYLDRYRETVETEMARIEMTLSEHSITAGNGNHLMLALERMGQVPPGWPRTPATKRLSATKDNLKLLNHPLADMHRSYTQAHDTIGYLEAVVARSRVTGRLHPEVNILGAMATGRMSYTQPALQQFPGPARKIIVDDGQGFTSIDWSSIEPVTLANMARDVGFLLPFEEGADLYEPIQRAAAVNRGVAKVVLLAGALYGQGNRKLALAIKRSVEGAAQIKQQMYTAMPESAKFMKLTKEIAVQHGIALTVSGRILTIPNVNGKLLDYKAINYGPGQGSALDILHDAVIRARDAGIADEIQLALHDEIIVSTPVAEQMELIMQTPPADLVRWAGRVPVLRTDRKDLGSTWDKPED